MRKMKLDLEAVTVETFRTAADEAGERGTVQGNGVDAFITVRITCPDTCGASCDSGNPCVYC